MLNARWPQAVILARAQSAGNVRRPIEIRIMPGDGQDSNLECKYPRLHGSRAYEPNPARFPLRCFNIHCTFSFNQPLCVKLLESLHVFSELTFHHFFHFHFYSTANACKSDNFKSNLFSQSKFEEKTVIFSREKLNY